MSGVEFRRPSYALSRHNLSTSMSNGAVCSAISELALFGERK
jgi:hypothetical protein